MSFSYVSAELRRIVVERAESICEYCLIAEVDTFLGCQVDHIIGEKHGGPTQSDNLALACTYCNQAKGSDIGSMHWDTGEFTRFFNPRKDRWSEHFQLVGPRIDGLTAIGAVTLRILAFNTAERQLERQVLQSKNLYPCPAAQKRLKN